MQTQHGVSNKRFFKRPTTATGRIGSNKDQIGFQRAVKTNFSEKFFKPIQQYNFQSARGNTHYQTDRAQSGKIVKPDFIIDGDDQSSRITNQSLGDMTNGLINGEKNNAGLNSQLQFEDLPEKNVDKHTKKQNTKSKYSRNHSRNNSKDKDLGYDESKESSQTRQQSQLSLSSHRVSKLKGFQIKHTAVEAKKISSDRQIEISNQLTANSQKRQSLQINETSFKRGVTDCNSAITTHTTQQSNKNIDRYHSMNPKKIPQFDLEEEDEEESEDFCSPKYINLKTEYDNLKSSSVMDGPFLFPGLDYSERQIVTNKRVSHIKTGDFRKSESENFINVEDQAEIAAESQRIVGYYKNANETSASWRKFNRTNTRFDDLSMNEGFCKKFPGLMNPKLQENDPDAIELNRQKQKQSEGLSSSKDEQNKNISFSNFSRVNPKAFGSKNLIQMEMQESAWKKKNPEEISKESPQPLHTQEIYKKKLESKKPSNLFNNKTTGRHDSFEPCPIESTKLKRNRKIRGTNLVLTLQGKNAKNVKMPEDALAELDGITTKMTSGIGTTRATTGVATTRATTGVTTPRQGLQTESSGTQIGQNTQRAQNIMKGYSNYKLKTEGVQEERAKTVNREDLMMKTRRPKANIFSPTFAQKKYAEKQPIENVLKTQDYSKTSLGSGHIRTTSMDKNMVSFGTTSRTGDKSGMLNGKLDVNGQAQLRVPRIGLDSRDSLSTLNDGDGTHTNYNYCKEINQKIGDGANRISSVKKIGFEDNGYDTDRYLSGKKTAHKDPNLLAVEVDDYSKDKMGNFLANPYFNLYLWEKRHMEFSENTELAKEKMKEQVLKKMENEKIREVYNAFAYEDMLKDRIKRKNKKYTTYTLEDAKNYEYSEDDEDKAFDKYQQFLKDEAEPSLAKTEELVKDKSKIYTKFMQNDSTKNQVQAYINKYCNDYDYQKNLDHETIMLKAKRNTQSNKYDQADPSNTEFQYQLIDGDVYQQSILK